LKPVPYGREQVRPRRSTNNRWTDLNHHAPGVYNKTQIILIENETNLAIFYTWIFIPSTRR